MHVVKASQCFKSIKSNAMLRTHGQKEYDTMMSCPCRPTIEAVVVLQYGPLTWFGIVAVHLFSTPTEARSMALQTCEVNCLDAKFGNSATFMSATRASTM